MHFANATSFSTTNTATANTKTNFLSFSGQTVLDQSKGPTLMEKLKANLFNLSINIHKLKFPVFLINFTAIFKLLQWYAICFLPRYSAFWNQDGDNTIFISILKVPLHLCVTFSHAYHGILALVIVLFYIIFSIHFFKCLTMDPQSTSFSNATIFWLRLFFQVLSPIFTTFLVSAWGFLLSLLIFGDNRTPIIIVSVVLGFFGIILGVIYHFLSFYLIRGTSVVDTERLLVPWASKIKLWALIELYFNLCAILEELVQLNKWYFRLVYSIICAVFYNPFVGWLMIRYPLFQSAVHGTYIATMTVVCFFSLIMLNIAQFISGLTPTIFCIVSLIVFIIVNIIFKYIETKGMSNDIKKLYSVYRSTHGVLPHLTPVVFTAPLANQVALSHEAYSTMQAFNSLEIKSAAVFRRYLVVGTEMRMHAITDIDFIKWGVNYFTDIDTLILCAQICQLFGEYTQTQGVLISRLMEEPNLGFLLQSIALALEHNYKDTISDKPLFMITLEKKAHSALSRCRRAIALFWGCVLNHSQATMKEALCRARDAISEADTHFDELLRCYPTTGNSIALNLSYLTEIKGEFLACSDYMNKMQAMLIDKNALKSEDGEASDELSTILNDPKRSFSNQIKNLGSYMEQERHLLVQTKAPIYVLLANTIVSFIVVLGSLIFVIAITLNQFNRYPKILDIVKTVKDVIVDAALMTFSSRRLCLFANDKITVEKFGVEDDALNPTVRPETLLKFLIDKSDGFTEKLKLFYQKATISDEMLNQLNDYTTNLYMYDGYHPGSLAYLLDNIGFWTKSIASNLPRNFSDPAYSMAQTPNTQSMEAKTQNYWDYIHEKKGEALRKATFIYAEGNHQHSHESTKTIQQSKKQPLEFNISDHPEDLYKSYNTICGSNSINQLILNIAPMVELADSFMNRFYSVSDKQIDNLDKILYWSMIIFPIAIFVIFGLFLLFSAIFIKKEAAFRNTLYLSLPEQIASELFRSGGGSSTKQKKKKNPEKDPSNPKIDLSTDKNKVHDQMFEYVQQENNIMKEKALQIESLQQFASMNGVIQGTGIQHFIAWMSIYLLISAATLFGLSYYARSVNSSFHSRSMLICYAALRFAAVEFTAIHVQEFFYFDPSIANLKMNVTNFNRLALQALMFLNHSERFEKSLTFGDVNITSDFREYKDIEKMYLSDLDQTIPNLSQIIQSVSTIIHETYPKLDFDSRIRLFLSVSNGIIRSFVKAYQTGSSLPFRVDDDTWKHYNHYIIDHINDDLEATTQIYIDSIGNVIDNSFAISLVISLISLFLLILIFAIPILMAVRALRGFFRMTTHILCQISPSVFARSMYINKWLKNQITRKNYQQYETYYKQTVSANLQTKIIIESPEKLLLFNSSLQFIPAQSLPLPGLEDDPPVEKVLSVFIDTTQKDNNKSILEQIRAAMEKFQDAKDTIDNIAFVTQSIHGTPLRVTISGITTSDTSLQSTSSIQRFYAFIAILVSDITFEANQEALYNAEKEKAMALLSEVIPRNFAIRLHDGERKVSFVSGIGSALYFEVVNFEEFLSSNDAKIIMEHIVKLKEAIDEILIHFENLSLMKFRDGKILFIAGLFNDEQNGRTEALDSINFVSQLTQKIDEIFNQDGIKIEMRCGLCTGGPIYAKLLMDSSPVCLAAGEPITLAKMIAPKCQPGQLILERTTYECIYGMNIDCQMAGEMDYSGKHISLYTVQIDRISEVKL